MAPPNRRDKERRDVRMASTKKYLDTHGSDWKPSAIAVPEGMELFRFETPQSDKGVLYIIDLVPYEVARHKGEPGGNPYRDEDEVGTLSYERTYYVHADVGTEEKRYTCPLKEFKEECPICEHVQELRSDPVIDKKKYIDPIKVKERQLFLIYDRTSKDSRKKGLQLFETAHYRSFGQLLKETLEANQLANPGSDLAETFAHPYEGMSLAVTVKKEPFSGDGGRSGVYGKPTTIQFVPRDRIIPDEVLDAVPCLDDLPIKVAYDKLSELFHRGKDKREEPKKMGGSSPRASYGANEHEDDDQEEAPKPAARRPAADRNGKKLTTAEDLGIEKGDEVEYEGEVCEVAYVSGDGTSLRLKDPSGKLIMGVSVEAVEKPDAAQDDPDDGEESPKAGTARSAGKKSASATKASSGSRRTALATEDDDEDEKPAAKKGGKTPERGKGKGSPPDDEDDVEDDDQDDQDDDDDDSEDDDDMVAEDRDDDDEAPPKKKPGGKGAPPRRRS